MAVLNYFTEKNNEFYDNLHLKEEYIMSMDCLGSINEYFSSFDNYIPDLLCDDNSDNIFQNFTDFKPEDTLSSYDLNEFDQINNLISDINFDYNEVICGEDKSVNVDELITINNFKLTEDDYITMNDPAIIRNDLKKLPEVIVMNKSNDFQKDIYSKYSQRIEISSQKINNLHSSNNIQYTKSILLRSQNKNHIHINMRNKILNDGPKLNLCKQKIDNKTNICKPLSENLNTSKCNMQQVFPQKSFGINFISKKFNSQKLSNVIPPFKSKNLIVKKVWTNIHNNKNTLLNLKLDKNNLNTNKLPFKLIFSNSTNSKRKVLFKNSNAECLNQTLNFNTKKMKNPETNQHLSENINLNNLNKDIILESFKNNEIEQEIFVKLIKLCEKSEYANSKFIKSKNINNIIINDNVSKLNEVNAANDIDTKEFKEIIVTKNIEDDNEEKIAIENLNTKNTISSGLICKISEIHNNKQKNDEGFKKVFFADNIKLSLNEIKNQAEVYTNDKCLHINEIPSDQNPSNNLNFSVKDINTDLLNIIVDDSLQNIDAVMRENDFDNCNNVMGNEILDLMQEADIQLVDIKALPEPHYEDIFDIGNEVEIDNFEENKQNEIQININYLEDKPKKKKVPTATLR